MTLRPDHARTAELRGAGHSAPAAGTLPADGVRGLRVAEQGDRLVSVAGLEYHGRFGLLRSVAVASAAPQGMASALIAGKPRRRPRGGL